MSSVTDENSPPRQDPLSKTRRQSMLDSPSRVTRSQVRRLSSAPAEATMSPKPSTRRRSTVAPAPVEAPASPKVSTRRRSTLSASSKTDAEDQDEVSSVQEEADTVKNLPRRRSVRKSFADGAEEGPLSSRSSKLTSIEEDSKPISVEEAKPVTRRTRASMASVKTPFEHEPDLPITRRTRRSSISSVSSITSSIVASPKRQTRSRKNLSPVPSPTFSEVSVVSEVPETSPGAKTTPMKDSSPMTKKTDKLLGTPRQLELNAATLKTKESPLVLKNGEENESPSLAHGLDSAKSRRSQERLSLKSPLQFVESEMEVTAKPSAENIGSPVEIAEVESRQSLRRSYGRQSLKSPLQFSESPMKDAPKPSPDAEKVSKDEEIVDVGFNKSRSSMGRLSLSSSKSSRLSLSSNKSVIEDNADSAKKTRESTGRLSRKSSPLKFDVSDKLSPSKSPRLTSENNDSSRHETSQDMSNGAAPFEDNELNRSRKSSLGQSPLLKPHESPSESFSTEDSDKTEASTAQQVFNVEDSSNSSLVEVVVEKRNSLGRLSLSSKKATPAKQQSSVSSPNVSNSETKGRFSLSLSNTPAKSPKFDTMEVSTEKSSLNRFSLSSNKSTPFKSPKGDASSQKEATTPSVLSSGFSTTPNKMSPANSLKCDTPQLTTDEPANTFLSRFSATFIKSTPNKPSPGKSPKCENTPQLNESRRSSLGRLSLSSNKSPFVVKDDSSEHLSDNEELNSVTSSEPTAQNESLGKLNLSTVLGKSSPRKSIGKPSLTPSKSLNNSHHQDENDSSDASGNDSSVNVDDASNDTSDGLSNGASNDASDFSNLNQDKSTPAKSLPAKSPKNTPQLQLNESRRSSLGRMSLSSNKSPTVVEADSSEHLSDNEESNSAPSSDLSGLDESLGKLNSSTVSGKQSPRKSTGKLSLTPSKSLNTSNHQEEDASNDSSDASEEAVNRIPEFSQGSAASRRASTGTLSSFAQSFKSDKKARASMGPLINPLVSFVDISEGQDDMSDSSVEIEDKSNASGERHFGAGELTLSPIKQDIPSKKNSLTPSSVKSWSEPERQKSPNNPFEKSTVFNEDSFASETSEQVLETSVSSHKTSQLNVSKTDKNVSIVDKTVDLNVSKKSSKGPVTEDGTATSNVGKKLDSSKIFKAAAVLLSGGNISDFDEEDSDDTQWQPVFSPNMTKKEQRFAKKAQKKAEKEARKKRKQEKALGFAVSSVTDGEENAVEEDNILSLSTSSISGKSKKRKSMEANLEVTSQQDEESVFCEKSNNKRRKTLSQSESGLPLQDTIALSPVALQNGSPDDENKQSAKKTKKRKSEGVASDVQLEGETNEISPVANNEDAETTSKKKKKKAKVMAAAELQSASEKSALKDKKKKKLKKKVAEDNTAVDDLSVKKKKKKQKLTSENQPVEESSTEILKIKKKKKNKNLVLQPTSVVEQNSNDGMSSNLPEKKKSKKIKSSVVDETVTGLKKSKKVSVSEQPSKKLKKKKLKEKSALEAPVAITAGSDSDDEPTAVSFSAGKSAALAMMEAAAENIKKQKELKKKKLKHKQEKIREEKSAKMQKLKEKKNDFVDESSSSGKASLLDSTSSKIYFDDKGKAQKVKAPKRLPAELLESLSEQPPSKLVRRPDGSKGRVSETAVSSEEQKKLELKKARILARKMEKQKLLQSEYVPLEGVLGATRFGVVPLRNVMLAKKLEKNKLAEEAANFRQQSLFGNRIRRTPISAAISYQDKLKASGKDRVVRKY